MSSSTIVYFTEQRADMDPAKVTQAEAKIAEYEALEESMHAEGVKRSEQKAFWKQYFGGAAQKLNVLDAELAALLPPNKNPAQGIANN